MDDRERRSLRELAWSVVDLLTMGASFYWLYLALADENWPKATFFLLLAHFILSVRARRRADLPAHHHRSNRP